MAEYAMADGDPSRNCPWIAVRGSVGDPQSQESWLGNLKNNFDKWGPFSV